LQHRWGGLIARQPSTRIFTSYRQLARDVSNARYITF
jgi:hypothetical protein